MHILPSAETLNLPNLLNNYSKNIANLPQSIYLVYIYAIISYHLVIMNIHVLPFVTLQRYGGWYHGKGCLSLIARFMGQTWGPSGADRTQVGPMLAP